MQSQNGHSRFDTQSHERLITMVAAGNVGEIRQQGEMWRQTARSLAERSDELLRQLEDFSPSWSGTAATQYAAMVAELADGIGEVAGVVALTRDLTFSAADCLAQAQARMPDLVPIPSLTPEAQVFATAGDTAAWNSLSEGQQADLTSAWQTMSADQQRKVAGEIKAYDQAVADADSARGRAIQVMNDLAAQYSVLNEALPELPRIAHAPPLPTTEDLALGVVDRLTENGWPVTEGGVAGQGSAGQGSTMVDPATGQPIDWSAWTQVPVDDRHALFGDVYAVGSIAASAAVLGIGGLGVRWIAERRAQEVREETAAALGQPAPWFGGQVPTPDGGYLPSGFQSADGTGVPDPTDATASNTVGAGSAALGGAGLGAGAKGLSGLGGLGGGGVGGALGAGLPDPRVANPAFTNGVGAASGAESRMLGALNTGAAAGRGGMPMGGMMPMMPMTGAGEGAGGGRKAPWLLEREPVFGGESVPVIPPVIGGQEPPETPRGRRSG